MKYRKRIYYTEEQKVLMWERWRKGKSLDSIGRHFGRNHSSIKNSLSRTACIRPSRRRRSGLVLTLLERDEIARGVVAGNRPLARVVEQKLRQLWAAEQIAGWPSRLLTGHRYQGVLL